MSYPFFHRPVHHSIRDNVRYSRVQSYAGINCLFQLHVNIFRQFCFHCSIVKHHTAKHFRHINCTIFHLIPLHVLCDTQFFRNHNCLLAFIMKKALQASPLTAPLLSSTSISICTVNYFVKLNFPESCRQKQSQYNSKIVRRFRNLACLLVVEYESFKTNARRKIKRTQF